MKIKDTNQSMITSFKRFGSYIEVIGNQSNNNQTNDLVSQLDLQVNNQTSPSQQRQQNRPNTLTNLWDIPPNISMPTAAPQPDTSITYKAVVQNVNQNQSAVHNVQQQPQ